MVFPSPLEGYVLQPLPQGASEEDWIQFDTDEQEARAVLLQHNPDHPRLSQTYLVECLDFTAMRWMYNGLHNLQGGTVNFALNPQETVEMYVGAWLAKRKNRLPEVGFAETAGYLAGFGRNALAPHFHKEKDYLCERNIYDEPLLKRCDSIPKDDKLTALASLRDRLKMPKEGRRGDFWVPEGVDATAHRNYGREIVRLLYG